MSGPAATGSPGAGGLPHSSELLAAAAMPATAMADGQSLHRQSSSGCRQSYPKLVAEGRRILLFSQFTFHAAADRVRWSPNWPSVLPVNRETQDRTAVVQRFQSGEVPLF